MREHCASNYMKTLIEGDENKIVCKCSKWVSLVYFYGKQMWYNVLKRINIL